MPRPSRERVAGAEANLAKRIQYERERRSLSYEALAKAMTEAGCKMQGSALYKIEKADPPRRITVDELAALSGVFDVPVSDLLADMELVEQGQARELVEVLQRNQRNLGILTNDMFNVMVDLLDIGEKSPELYQYVMGHFLSKPRGEETEGQWVELADPVDVLGSVTRMRSSKAGNDFLQAVLKTAGLWRAGQRGELEDDESHARLQQEYDDLRTELGLEK